MTQRGFWKQFNPMNNSQVVMGINYGFINNVYYICPQGGGPRGAYSTFASLKSQIRNKDVIILSGVLREQAVAPDGVFDVTIWGAANTPRQATSGGTPTGGGASWMPPSSGAVATTPLLELTRAGWQIGNIEFTPHTSSGGVRLTRSASVDLIDASHASFYGCYFAANGGSGQLGIEDNGGSSRVFVDDCRFEGLAFAIKGLNTGAAVPLGWLIQGNRFQQNTNDVAMSLSYGIVQKNNFMTAGSGATNKVVSTTYVSVQGGNNFIIDNQFNNTEAQIAPGNGFTGAATDVWRNFVTDGTWYAIGQPA